MICIRVLGEMSVWAGDPLKKQSVRSLGRVLVYMALQEGDFVRRRQVAIDLWPDEPYTVSGNRLRVSLNRIKELAGAQLTVEREEVALRVSAKSLDLIDARARIREALDEVDPEKEVELLRTLANVLGKTVLSDWDESWLMPSRGEWRLLCMRALRRLAELCEGEADWTGVISACDAARAHQVVDRDLWQLSILAHYRLGELDSVFKELRALEAKNEDEERGEMLLELLRYARGLRDSGAEQAERVEKREEQFLGGILRQFLNNHPVATARFFVSEEMESYFFNGPGKAAKIIERLMLEIEEGSEEWVKLGILLSGCYYVLYEWQRLVAIVEKVLVHAESAGERARLIYFRSWSMFQTRHWDAAMEDILHCEKLYYLADLPEQARVAAMNRASYLWHLGEYEDALKIYSEYTNLSDGVGNRLLTRYRAATHGNTAFVFMILRRNEDARTHIEECERLAAQLGYTRMRAITLPLAAVIYARLGELDRAIELSVSGLRLVYAENSSREAQISLESVAGVLAEIDHSAEAVAVLDWVDAWRQKTEHGRSVAELRYVDEIYGAGNVSRNRVRLDPDESLRNVMAFVIRLLRQAQTAQA